jgi:hypothetical protein
MNIAYHGTTWWLQFAKPFQFISWIGSMCASFLIVQNEFKLLFFLPRSSSLVAIQNKMFKWTRLLLLLLENYTNNLISILCFFFVLINFFANEWRLDIKERWLIWTLIGSCVGKDKRGEYACSRNGRPIYDTVYRYYIGLLGESGQQVVRN